MSTDTHTLAEAIDAARSGRTTVMRCPAHDDQSPSLSVGPGERQPVVMNCHAGCDPKDIVESQGLSWDDFCTPREEMEDRRPVWTPAGETDPSLVYPYVDEEGTLLYEVLRVHVTNEDGTAGKRFLQRRPDPVQPTRWLWKLGETQRVPFNLPRLIEVVANGGTVHVAEGEKCVRALEAVIPATDAATCNSGGALKWQPEFAGYFTPGTRVIVYADADDKGRQHARLVRDNLTEAGCMVRTVEAPPGRLRSGKEITDVADHLAAGRDLGALLETTPESDAQRARTGVDVTDLVRRTHEPEEMVIEGTLAQGERMLLVGLEGRGKSTLLRQIAVCTAAGLHPFFGTRMEPKRVLFIDAENHPSQVTNSWADLVGLATRHASPVEPGMLTVLEEWDAEHDLTSMAGRTWLTERVYGYRPDLLILGPLTNLAEPDLKTYEAVHALRRSINSVRSVCNSAIIMEHHAPYRASGDKIREVRPYGHSLFVKWPDYGFAMVPTDDDTVYEWRANRGPRVRSRLFPSALRQGDAHTNSIEWPWMECAPL
jgi:5S rRNA maturation endonuclease (ribonuclease M5)